MANETWPRIVRRIMEVNDRQDRETDVVIRSV
jgi:hypothetical protein